MSFDLFCCVWSFQWLLRKRRSRAFGAKLGRLYRIDVVSRLLFVSCVRVAYQLHGYRTDSHGRLTVLLVSGCA